jgi:hypothetical protein
MPMIRTGNGDAATRIALIGAAPQVLTDDHDGWSARPRVFSRKIEPSDGNSQDAEIVLRYGEGLDDLADTFESQARCEIGRHAICGGLPRDSLEHAHLAKTRQRQVAEQ